MEEKTEWETVVTCDHSYNRRCAKSLITVYNSAQVRILCNRYTVVCIRLYKYLAATQEQKHI